MLVGGSCPDRYSPAWAVAAGRLARFSRPMYPRLQIDGVGRKEAFGVASANAVQGGCVAMTSYVLEDHPLSRQAGQQVTFDGGDQTRAVAEMPVQPVTAAATWPGDRVEGADADLVKHCRFGVPVCELDQVQQRGAGRKTGVSLDS